MATALPVDICLSIFSYLSVEDIWNVRLSCKLFAEITHLRSLWQDLLRTHIHAQDIPLPSLPSSHHHHHYNYGTLDSLNARELEQLTTRALQLRRNWCSPTPTATTRRTLRVHNSRIVELKFISHASGRHRYLVSLSLSNKRGLREWELSCWDLQALSLLNQSKGDGTDNDDDDDDDDDDEKIVLTCVARRTFVGLNGFAFNSNCENSDVVVAMQTSCIEMIGLDVDADKDPSDRFTTLAMYPTRRNHRIQHLSGQYIVDMDRNDNTFIWSTENPDCEMELRMFDNDFDVRNEPVRDVLIMMDRFVLVNRSKDLFLYALPPPPPPQDQGAGGAGGDRFVSGRRALLPVAEHTWAWAVDSMCLSPQIFEMVTRTGKPAPINILLRFGSYLPWVRVRVPPLSLRFSFTFIDALYFICHTLLQPINLLHYYALEPNPTYEPMHAVTANNLPYGFPPQLKRTIAAPVLLFSTTHMALGPYGTAMWIDNHTEEGYFGGVEGEQGQQGQGGQRVGSVLCPVFLDRGEGEEEEGWVGELDGDDGDGDGDGEGEDGEEWVVDEVTPMSSLSTMAMSVFVAQQGDGWCKLAMDEEEGRIAVGSVDGRILVLDYV
ncbi:hypothetical protein AMATHDRAFT_50878 [Amanita thiersii Skay4041]|uniref:F-box domain-containing protein n=1 Tax=Amanita thiersii Skay4041 TaxID=703135 RepID=A0A2A9N8H5_9AGAR|nr:hypothetical protein AMATHDRAFT_50878 [Amanita thiersii Skay4041]